MRGDNLLAREPVNRWPRCPNCVRVKVRFRFLQEKQRRSPSEQFLKCSDVRVEEEEHGKALRTRTVATDRQDRARHSRDVYLGTGKEVADAARHRLDIHLLRLSECDDRLHPREVAA